MKYPRSLLKGYDKEQAKLIAKTLHMPVQSKTKMKKKRLKGVRR